MWRALVLQTIGLDSLHSRILVTSGPTTSSQCLSTPAGNLSKHGMTRRDDFAKTSMVNRFGFVMPGTTIQHGFPRNTNVHGFVENNFRCIVQIQPMSWNDRCRWLGRANKSKNQTNMIDNAWLKQRMPRARIRNCCVEVLYGAATHKHVQTVNNHFEREIGTWVGTLLANASVEFHKAYRHPLKIATLAMFSRIFETLGEKKNQKPMFLRGPGKKNTVFFNLNRKNHGIYNVFVPVPCENTLLYVGFTLLRDIIPICKNEKKPLYFPMFLLLVRSQKLSKNRSKTDPNPLPKASYNFSLAIPGPRPPTW